MAQGTHEGEEKALKALVSGHVLPLSEADREDGFSERKTMLLNYGL